MPEPIMAFSIRANGILRVLKTQIEVSAIGLANVAMIEAIWDTGASGSTITTKVVQSLGLTPIGMTQVSTANGVTTMNTYLVNIRLPNGLGIRDVTVTECAGLSSGCDALIGMDIITLGDFSITNHQGKTVMSFRYPSSHVVDYVDRIHHGIKRNLPAGTKGSNTTPQKKKRR